MVDATLEEMDHDASRPTSITTERAKPVCCTQCGDSIDPVRIALVTARNEKVMCRDCAFDEMPCTD